MEIKFIMKSETYNFTEINKEHVHNSKRSHSTAKRRSTDDRSWCFETVVFEPQKRLFTFKTKPVCELGVKRANQESLRPTMFDVMLDPKLFMLMNLSFNCQ